MGGRVPPLTRLAALLAALPAGAAGAPRTAQAQARPAVHATVVPELDRVPPGGALRVAVVLVVPAGYHLSWPNPGQSGLPTTLSWQAPAGFHPGPAAWPAPDLDTSAGMASHVYRGTVVVLTRFRVDAPARLGRTVLRAAMSWGLCGATCLPVSDSVEAAVLVREGQGDTAAAWRALRPALGTLPVRDSGLVMRAALRGDSVRLTVEGPALATGTGASGRAAFFPLPTGAAVVVKVARGPRGVAVTLPGRVLGMHPILLDGVLVGDWPWLAGSASRALIVEASVRYQ